MEDHDPDEHLKRIAYGDRVTNTLLWGFAASAFGLLSYLIAKALPGEMCLWCMVAWPFAGYCLYRSAKS